MKKCEISNISTPKLLDFLNNSILYGDQTLDIKKDKLYCKASNNSMSNIIYREMLFGEDVEVSKDFPDHIRFFIQDYKILHSIAKTMNNEGTITLTMAYDGNICKQIMFKNKYIDFSITSSEMGLARYIEDEKFDSIKYPSDIVSKISIVASKISEIKSLHKLSKSDNEKTNLIFIYQSGSNMILEHESVKGVWKMEMESENMKPDTDKYALSLDIFDNLGSNTTFDMIIANLGSRKACYLTASTGVEFINISSVEKKE